MKSVQVTTVTGSGFSPYASSRNHQLGFAKVSVQKSQAVKKNARSARTQCKRSASAPPTSQARVPPFKPESSASIRPQDEQTLPSPSPTPSPAPYERDQRLGRARRPPPLPPPLPLLVDAATIAEITSLPLVSPSSSPWIVTPQVDIPPEATLRPLIRRRGTDGTFGRYWRHMQRVTDSNGRLLYTDEDAGLVSEYEQSGWQTYDAWNVRPAGQD